jgi:NADP-dependent aldehyde dehydrogenase
MRFRDRSLIGFSEAGAQTQVFSAVNPVTGEKLAPEYSSTTTEEIERTVQLAQSAVAPLSRATGKTKAKLLHRIAHEIEARADEIVPRTSLETALPETRLRGETTRTCNQLRMFASLVEEGSWVQARIDPGDPSRKPAVKPDVRSMLRPLGPVAVFGASNFPLAFSVAGGDTASALAAGNPVIVKAHPAHPGTAELVADAVRTAARECEAPEGVFSLLFDAGTSVGSALVQHPLVKAVAFTGSRVGGEALMRAAALRAEPIPFFAEMGSGNPVFLLPGALRERGREIALALHASMMLGAGQFCTKPGLVFLSNRGSDGLVGSLTGLFAQGQPSPLLSRSICKAYSAAIEGHKQWEKMRLLAAGAAAVGAGFMATPALFAIDASTYLVRADLEEEIFGPAALLVLCSAREELFDTARSLHGHLTATLHATEEDLREYANLVALLETKVGRVIINGVPTGVEVGHAMVHGGPYPAASDSRSTSVGTRAIYRFARPVCYQDFPDFALPDELKDSNPLGIWRMINGEFTRSAAGERPRVSKAI